MGHKRVGDMAGGSPVRHPALWMAAAHGRTERALQLLVGGDVVDIEARGGARGCTPLSEASLQGNLEVLELLLEAGAEIFARDCKGATALHYAAFQESCASAMSIYRTCHPSTQLPNANTLRAHLPSQHAAAQR